MFDTPDQPDAEEQVNEAAAALGLVIEEALELDDEFWLWPENEPAFAFWLSIQTQWNAGMERRTGLNYPGVEACMRLRRIPPKERPALFESVQVMEQACLEAWAQEQ